MNILGGAEHRLSNGNVHVMGKGIYKASAVNSMVELVDVHTTSNVNSEIESSTSYRDMVVFPCETNVEFPKRNFWEIVERFSD